MNVYVRVQKPKNHNQLKDIQLYMCKNKKQKDKRATNEVDRL